MLIVQKRISPQPTYDAGLVLPFELRQKSRLRATVASGEEIGLFLERGTVLRDGECLQADDGRIVRVVAADEDLIEVRCADAEALARAAYHLGNRHTPAQIGTGWLRIAADGVLGGMLRGLGATVTPIRAPFEPEAGAYASGHHAHSGEAKHTGIIHDSLRMTGMAPDPSTKDGARMQIVGVSSLPGMAPDPSTKDGATMQDRGMPSLLPLVRLLQLASPALPIGAYSYSQGLERIVEDGVVHDATSARAWIGDVLELVVARGEAAVAWRLFAAARHEDWQGFAKWNAWFRASRETAELRAETEQMGSSLAKLAGDLDLLDSPARNALARVVPVTLPAAFALAARGFAVPGDAALAAYVWSWLENQVLAAVKLVPVGQVAGQRLIASLAANIPAAIMTAQAIGDDELSTFAPGLALASARHETQYTRLFRS